MSRFGFVAIAGRPNTGKSTLLNKLAGQKLSIVSSVPQTTRHPARFVLVHRDAQIAFVDLPGLAKPRTLLGKRLNEAASAAAASSDLVLLLVDAKAGVGKGDAYLARLICASKAPVVGVVNKVDAVPKSKVAEALQALGELSDDLERRVGEGIVDFVPISAKTGWGLDVLLDVIAARLPEGPHLFPDNDGSDGEEEGALTRRIAEIIREKLIAGAREELPYSIAVLVEDISFRRKGEEELVEIFAKVLVERESQKAIVIGSGGSALKRAGTEARRELEALLGARVFLDLRVVVEKDWQKNPKILEKLGL